MLASLLSLLAIGAPATSLQTVGVSAPGPSTVVVLATSSGHRPGFVDALRIQMADLGKVEAGPAVGAGTRDDRTRRASEEVIRRGARVAVWLERAAERDRYRLHIVGRRQGKWIRQVRSLEAREGPATDRALALKVRDVLDVLIDSLDAQQAPRSISAVRKEAPAPRARPTPVPTPALWLELGSRGTIGDGSPIAQGGAYIAVGVRRRYIGLEYEPYVGVGYDVGQHASGVAGQIETAELVGALGARVLSKRRSLRIGASLDARLRRIMADGTSAGGGTGSETVVVPEIGLAGEIRLPLRGPFALRAALGIAATTRRRRFAVNEISLVDVGRVRAEAELGIVFSVR